MHELRLLMTHMMLLQLSRWRSLSIGILFRGCCLALPLLKVFLEILEEPLQSVHLLSWLEGGGP